MPDDVVTNLRTIYQDIGLGGSMLWCANYANTIQFNQTDIDWELEDLI